MWLVFRIADRLFTRRTALVAAACLALAFLHVRDSHFGVTDVAATCLALASFLYVIRFDRSKATRDLIVAALWAGLAMSTKYGAAMIAAPAIWICLWPNRPSRWSWFDRVKRLTSFVVVMGIAFAVTSPYCLIAFDQFINALGAVSTHLATPHAVMLGRGWQVHLTSSLRYGLGVPLLVAGLGGLVLLQWRHPRDGILVLLRLRRTAQSASRHVRSCRSERRRMVGSKSMASAAPVDEEEVALVARLRAGDETAYEYVVRTYGRRLLTLARRILGSEEDARDAVQEAFLNAFRSLNRFEGGSRFSTWLHRIAVNAALMKLRTRRRKPEQSLEHLLPSFNEDGHHAERFASWDEPVDRALERAETQQIVRAHIDELPEKWRTVLVLRDIEGLDTEETARMLKLSPNAVKIRLHRARQALRTLLAPHFRSATP